MLHNLLYIFYKSYNLNNTFIFFNGEIYQNKCLSQYFKYPHEVSRELGTAFS